MKAFELFRILIHALSFKNQREKIVDWALESEIFYTAALTYKIRLSKEIAYKLGNFDVTINKN